MAAGRPLVTSANDAARDYLTRGAIFVDNTAADIAVGIRQALQHERTLAREMADLASERDTLWRARASELRHELGLD
jgi:glycosyltransferase involved in cell wall biosynthesis